MDVKMLNATFAVANVFNPKKQGRLPAICEQLLLTPAHKLSKMIKDGQLSSARLCQLVSERIKQVQPHINCMCQDRFEAALEEAGRIDSLLAEFRSGVRQEADFSPEERRLLNSPLLGIPISIKESIQVKGMRNSCGLWERRNEVADEDAVAVATVRRFGLIPICTSNVPECTLFWADCQNYVYGRSRNPYDLSRITGASSGGEGGLLGSGATLLGVGSDIGGSLRIPAHYCGVYSHKPSPFLISSEGNFPPLKPARLRLFTLGPMARYASDLRPLLKCLLQDEAEQNPLIDSYYDHQPKDIATKRQQLLAKLDEQADLSKLKVYYFKFNESSQLKGKRSIRIQEELMRGQQELLEHLVSKFNCATEEVNLDRYLKKTMITWQCMLRCAGTKNREVDYEEDEIEHQFGITSLAMEFIKMPLGMSKHTKESLLVLVVGSALPKEREKIYALAEKFEKFAQEIKEEMNLLLGDSGVLVMPTLPTVAHKQNVSLIKTPDLRFPSMFNVLELPVTHATIRLDEAHQLPYGVSIAARPYNDHLTLALAEEIELTFGGWTPPRSGEQLKAAAVAGKSAAASTKEKQKNIQQQPNNKQGDRPPVDRKQQQASAASG